jgi:hypothetical protein
MAFVAPTRLVMQQAIQRALRDPDGDVFQPATIWDFINESLADLSQYRPKDARDLIQWPINPADPPPFTDFIDIWAVQYRVIDPNDSTHVISTITIPPIGRSAYDSRGGWDFFGHALVISDMWNRQLDSITAQGYAVELTVLGYADRDQPDADDDILDLAESADYLCLLENCKFLGFDLLNHDRSLYQQWIAATNNTDVSPTQLQGMAAIASQSYERIRSRNTRLRRVPAGDLAAAY